VPAPDIVETAEPLRDLQDDFFFAFLDGDCFGEAGGFFPLGHFLLAIQIVVLCKAILIVFFPIFMIKIKRMHKTNIAVAKIYATTRKKFQWGKSYGHTETTLKQQFF